MKLTYIIGEPGSGKTTIVRRLTKSVPQQVKRVPYVSWTHYSDKVCQLGHDRDTFGGTDALGMASQKHVLKWLEEDCDYGFVLAEGDRLANATFFDAVSRFAELQVVTVVCDEADVLDARRSERNARVGKAQNPGWLAGRATKVQNLRSAYGSSAYTIDTSALSVREATQALLKVSRPAREILKAKG